MEELVLFTSPPSVRKRDGITTQAFDVEKIMGAIRKAWIEVEGGEPKPAVLRGVAFKVARVLGDAEVGVETIQDAVETALMASGRFAVAKAYILYREKRAEARRARRAPDPGAVSGYIHASKYARYVPELQRREVFDETVSRVEMMHHRRFAAISGLSTHISRAFDAVREMCVLPSMRSMQFGGRAIEVNHNRQYNCSATLIDRPRAFAEAMFLLLSGCGVGYSVQIEHVEKLPSLVDVDERRVVHHVIEDTIEGWADALDALINGFISGYHVEFAYHLIRKAGTPLKTSGGRAPGHQKLKLALERVREVLEGVQGRQLRPIECHRILCHVADAVLSGGIRRSAMICLFSLEDSELMNIKAVRGWLKKEPWLQNANNSVVLKRDEVKEKQFKRIFSMTRNYGEPGVLFVNDYSHVTNPCGEVGLDPVLRHPDGTTSTGWAMCVSGDTRLITRTGIETIEEAVGRQIEIWNGSKWSAVTPFITGTDRKLYRVSFGDGSYLDCTDNHKFLVKDRFMSAYLEVEACDLLKVSKYAVHVPRANISDDWDGTKEPFAYEYGFFLGDGDLTYTAAEAKGERYYYARARLFGSKIDLPLQGIRYPLHEEGTVPSQVIRMPIDVQRAYNLKEIDALPKEVFGWDALSIIRFISGWADADGSHANDGIRVYSTEGRIRDLQLLLTKVGIIASVNLMSRKGTVTNKGTRTADVWYAQIPDATKLVTHRLLVERGKAAPSKGKNLVVESVEELPGLHTTFCVEESYSHTCLFNNVVTKQCNLTEINAAKLRTHENFIDAAWAATLIGTLQATYTDMPYLGKITEEIVRRDALIGVGMTGMQDAPAIACNAELQRTVARMIVEWNAEWAKLLGINPAARTTLIKPSGTTSLELGNVGSGIHPHHARRYIRRVTADELEIVFQAFRAVNPHMCVRRPDGKWMLEFPVEAPEGAALKEDMTAEQFMDVVRSTQQNWVVPGTTRASAMPGLSHNVSNTITVRRNEWALVPDYLWRHRDSFTGVSLLPDDGDTVYPFAPFEAVRTEAQERHWNELVAHYKPVDYLAIVEAEDATDLAGEAACAGPNGSCSIV